MWDSFCQHFDNVTLSVASALDEINDFRHTQEEDYEGVVKLIRQVESIYQQLQILDQIKLVSNRELNLMISYFPPLMRKEWAEHHFKLDVAQQLTPFELCHKFLCEKIKIAKHMADTQHFLKAQKQNVTKFHKPVAKSAFTTIMKQQSALKCCVNQSGGHSTAVCRQFAALSVQERRDKLKKAGLCFLCFGNHRRSQCKEQAPCTSCSRTTHYTLMYNPREGGSSGSASAGSAASSHMVAANVESPVTTSVSSTNVISAGVESTLAASAGSSHVIATTVETSLTEHQGSGSAAAENYAVRGESGLTLYAIYQAPVSSSREMAVIFCDDGSNTTFISQDGVRKLNAKKLAKTTLEITTLNGTETVSTCIYEVIIITASGRKVPINVIELPKLTGVVSQLDGKVLSLIFPDFDVNILQRPSAPVDILLGGDYFSLHPKRVWALCRVSWVYVFRARIPGWVSWWRTII